jgi:formimidoylglutamate deiminase
MTAELFAEHALLPDGWARDVLLKVNAQGQWHSILRNQEPAKEVLRASGPVLPGMPNLHSHAFQRALAGLTEYRSDTDDSFWSWRTLMYKFAAHLSPEQLEAIAIGLYVEMLEAGFTSVCEFHYLHHHTDGKAFADPAEMSLSLLRAARHTGIGLTLLPVLYQTSGFGGAAPTAAQRRFIHSTEAMLRLLDRLLPVCQAQSARLGLAPHSLRAVPPDSLREVLAGLDAMDVTAPIHIHIAEQRAEVTDCLAWSGQRPVAWLLDHAPVDKRWCLVHATHMDAQEYQRAAQSGAVTGLCPTTEANLGDGIFEFNTWQSYQGAWGVGSDSHIAVHPAEDLMLLEYGQRLALGRRNVVAHNAQPDVAQCLWQGALAGGAQAAGRAVAGLAVGQQADLIVLDAAHPTLAGLSPEMMLASHVFASSRSSAIAQVWSSGRPLVQHGRHALHDVAMAGLVKARSELLKT